MEPSAVLDKLKSFVETKKPSEKKGHVGIVTSVIFFFVGLIALVVFAWRSSRNSKELAKLRHEKFARTVEKGNQAVSVSVEKNKKRSKKISREVESIESKILSIDESIKKAENARQKDKEAINSITSWGDL